ncbi:spore cortex biosynthesis protein YabQ [Filibacter tadaridae]|uniref:Spore cortex protein YabQ (Spore_YabQ) n=1 Tax=Filibacter tadaridae TaxID=2483811 RepID=A0A3P5WUD6_9BACL|nr:spore cortex biosynthesis protein YabQ [Filibacter tadaridae]VDC18881.1 Spore cortex protein YabQ (Spore_YabQ) [Filibacter tadaridae]
MSLSLQFLSLLAMIGTGIVAGAFMDMIGTGTTHAGNKSLIKKRAIWLEIIGWILVGCGTFYILYLVRDGAWRMYDPFAQISGMLLYVSFFHKPFRLLGRILLMIFVKPVWFLICFVLSIIRQIILFIVKVIAFLSGPFVRKFRVNSRKVFKKRPN